MDATMNGLRRVWSSCFPLSVANVACNTNTILQLARNRPALVGTPRLTPPVAPQLELI